MLGRPTSIEKKLPHTPAGAAGAAAARQSPEPKETAAPTAATPSPTRTRDQPTPIFLESREHFYTFGDGPPTD